MRYDVEADWTLLHTCNYRCPYCFFPDHVLGRKLTVHATPDQWGDAFDDTGLAWLIHITGGEPTAYPGFADLCQRLTRRHTLSINSNLTLKGARDFAERVDPARVAMINAAVHPRERTDRNGWTVFLDNVQRLRAGGFPVMLTVVATPEALAHLDEVNQAVASTGLVVAPKLLRGIHDGRRFPRDYGEADRALFRRHAAVARDAYRGMLAALPEPPTIHPFDDDRFLGGLPGYVGADCAAGSRFVSITPNGTVHRCSATTTLGNILLGTMTLQLRPSPCDTRFCYYFCEKYSAHSRRRPPPGSQRDLSAALG